MRRKPETNFQLHVDVTIASFRIFFRKSDVSCECNPVAKRKGLCEVQSPVADSKQLERAMRHVGLCFPRNQCPISRFAIGNFFVLSVLNCLGDLSPGKPENVALHEIFEASQGNKGLVRIFHGRNARQFEPKSELLFNVCFSDESMKGRPQNGNAPEADSFGLRCKARSRHFEQFSAHYSVRMRNGFAVWH